MASAQGEAATSSDTARSMASLVPVPSMMRIAAKTGVAMITKGTKRRSMRCAKRWVFNSRLSTGHQIDHPRERAVSCASLVTSISSEPSTFSVPANAPTASVLHHRDALAREGRLIHRARAFAHDAVERHPIPRPHLDPITTRHLSERHLHDAGGAAPVALFRAAIDRANRWRAARGP